MSLNIKQRPSPNFSFREDSGNILLGRREFNPCDLIKYVILHYTGMETAAEAVARMCDSKAEVSCHYFIDYDGTISQLVQDEHKAWHAGISYWQGISGLNNYSIGIEVANKGHEFGYEEFSPHQIDNLLKLLSILRDKYNIPKANYIAHSDIAPDRKEDLGELFPWSKLANAGFGVYIEQNSTPHYENSALKLGDKARDIKEAKENLRKLGYKISQVDDIFDKEFEQVVTAFYRHFCPERILAYPTAERRYPKGIKWDGKANKLLINIRSTIET